MTLMHMSVIRLCASSKHGMYVCGAPQAAPREVACILLLALFIGEQAKRPVSSFT